ncbi:hypothetical protein BST93_12450 [Nonlabens tegetincola]|nr:hypothetical protein BST93_12450 [Nonlabens tegetincola]
MEKSSEWLAPYVLGALGLLIVLFFAQLILIKLQRKKDFIWYRQMFVYKKLPLSRKRILENYPFYKRLSSKYQKQFEHRVAHFISQKNFKNRYGESVTDEQFVLPACVACELTFGRRQYTYGMLDTLLFFPEPFTSPTNNALHKGEYNPSARVLAMSWPDFLHGMADSNDNLHLGLHEFCHVLHFESEHSTNVDAQRFHKQHQLILRRLMDPEVKKRLDNTAFFREYAFTNQYEFMAVLTEYFIESPKQFKSNFPILFKCYQTALLYKDEWLDWTVE